MRIHQTTMQVKTGGGDAKFFDTTRTTITMQLCRSAIQNHTYAARNNPQWARRRLFHTNFDAYIIAYTYT